MDNMFYIAIGGTVFTVIGTGIAVIGLIYSFIRNFKTDVDSRFDKIEKEFHEMDKRVYATNQRMDGIYNVILKRMEEGKR